jgi:hypothetical protein
MAPRRQPQSPPTPNVSLRPFPYPYTAALTICSDIDGTRTVERFLAIQEFLNTDRLTPMGRGISLDIGNSFLASSDRGELSYVSGGPEARRLLKIFIESGHVDCLHSYGSAEDRESVGRLLDVLAADRCRLEVWIDHATAISNFGNGQGGTPGAVAYHADLTRKHGIRFVWRGRSTSIVGQERRTTFVTPMGLLDPRHPLASTRIAVREITKRSLARTAPHLSVHRSNHVIEPLVLDDGTSFWEFVRYYGYWRIGVTSNCHTLAHVIRSAVLERLARLGGYCLVYTHLGLHGGRDLIPEATVTALRRLAEMHRSGAIWVSTTSTLLRHCLVRRHLIWHAVLEDGQTVIEIEGIADPLFPDRQTARQDLDFLTFYVPDSSRGSVRFAGAEIEVTRNGVDATGRESITIPGPRLVYPM